MKKLCTLLALVLSMGTLFMTSCKAPENGKNDSKAVADTINSMMNEITKSACSLNADATFKYLSTDSTSVFVSDGMHYSLSDLKAAFTKVYGGLKNQQIDIVFSDVLTPAAGTAIWTAYLKNSYTTKADQTVESYLCETWVWQHKAEGWKVIHYHESTMKLPSTEQKAVVETALGKLALEMSAKTPLPADMKAILTSFLTQNPTIYGATLAFAPTEVNGKTQEAAPYFYRSGGAITQTELPVTYNYTKSEWYAIPVQTKAPYWSKPYYDAQGGGVVMTTYSIPVYNKENVLTGVLTSDMELQ